MLTTSIKEAENLKKINLKAAYNIARELANINVNILFYPENIQKNISRLKSLADHVKIEFKEYGKNLIKEIKDTIARMGEI